MYALIYMKDVPGSLTYSTFQAWNWGQSAPTPNLFSWTNMSNVVWVEQPVGVSHIALRLKTHAFIPTRLASARERLTSPMMISLPQSLRDSWYSS